MAAIDNQRREKRFDFIGKTLKKQKLLQTGQRGTVGNLHPLFAQAAGKLLIDLRQKGRKTPDPFQTHGNLPGGGPSGFFVPFFRVDKRLIAE